MRSYKLKKHQQKKKSRKLIEKYFLTTLANHILQLALKLHPDKNRAPKATEAFKKLS